MKFTDYCHIIALSSILLLSGCDLLSKPNDAFVKVAENIKTANNNGIDANNNTGIKISSPTINISPKVETSIKIMDKYNVPMVDVGRMDITLYKKNPSDCIVTRTYKKYNDVGNLVSDEVEVSKPIVQSKAMSFIEWAVFFFILVNTFLMVTLIRRK